MTYYQILGVKKSASQAEIKDAYKKLMKKYHPDIYKGDKAFAEQKAKEINLAYDVLSNPSSRIAYDEEINPEPKYQYTPPKYTSAEDYYQKSSYTNYYNNNPNYYRNTSSTYNNVHNGFSEMHNNFSSSVMKSLSKMKLIQKIILFLLILLIYIVFILLSLSNFGKITNSTSTEDDNQTSSYYNEVSIPRESFNIYDFLTEEELQKLYDRSRYKDYYSFDEFKVIIEEYFYRTYYGY